MFIDVQLASFFTAGAIIVLGIYAALFLDNIIKKIIGLSFITEGVNLFLVTIGYKPGGVVSIFLPGMSREWFVQNSAYPLPYAMVLTSIVIGASTLAVMLGIVIILYKKHSTLSASKVLRDDEETGDAGE
ncbi:MAG: cation:proton antiporter subunit C [Methanobacteriaceae archaeon]|nr:cation:proton antiporter subunit C [Methanobacteriaceae archaeon]